MLVVSMGQELVSALAGHLHARGALMAMAGSWGACWDWSHPQPGELSPSTSSPLCPAPVGAAWALWGLRDGRQGWPQHGQWAWKLIQKLADSQTGFAGTLGAGREPVLVWKLCGRANATVTQSSTRHGCRAVSAGSAAADRRACPGVGRGHTGTAMETFNLHLKQTWLPRGEGGSSLSW